ncbi:TIGR03619 family F420-dependent LLM class oxidoreductase [Kutzneria viridogrisea]|uniref:Luciferase-like domain-containing protein n=2 Tax=Kutzneria TaxID=43356 RepID=W5WQC3_9PSEU|nr:TIGR03619 family F420-dependent LLM class oxidoreductase [Kutzneria albida]AHI00380.1 hypothetical protein KALB_7022 [Kutzneria albida DSM 43870]MBA8925557.1 putative F420-dependent oxidoreductase [Kutzneria viridogrisea]
MRIGFSLPQFGMAGERPADVVTFAVAAEKAGADSLWVGDRLLSPVDPSIGYGMSGPGPYPREFRRVLDPLTLLTAAATATTRVRLGTHVLCAPWYPPLLLARTLASIDQLSGGRVVPGFGVGWSPEEYAAAGVPMAERGARLDEVLDVLEAAWSQEVVTHEGPGSTIAPSWIDLKPAHRPRIHLGGFAPAALRRVGRRAEGWLPAGAVPGLDPAQYAGPLQVIRQAAEQAGRDPGAIEVVLRLNPRKGSTVDNVVDTLLAARDTGIVDEAMVELVYLAPELEQSLDVVGQVLTRLS